MYKWQKDMLDKLNQFKGKGLVTLTGTGRQIGKSRVYDTIRDYYDSMYGPIKIMWRTLPGNKLQAYHTGLHRLGLSPADYAPIEQWCKETGIGQRIDYNVWQFKDEKQITLFLLRWS